ncbi:hypothetical protein F895_00521 [Acinetobacter sp. CIP 64.2]|nr:hypothetical protein F895_00521 [Acinetobacter sp. CIP 64.2]
MSNNNEKTFSSGEILSGSYVPQQEVTSASGISSAEIEAGKPLKRAMTKRHLVMISLGGAIGTGLFLGSGDVISQAGPVGAIISYFLGGVIAYMVMLCLGELAVHMPVSGSFGEYARTYIGPGTGYMITWL